LRKSQSVLSDVTVNVPFTDDIQRKKEKK